MSASTTPTSDPSPVQAILSGAETGGFSGSGRVERHAIARGDGGRVRAARLVIDVGSPVPDELPGQGFALGLSPLPRRNGVRLRPQAAFRISCCCFEFGERTDIRSILPVPPSEARPHQLVIEDAAIGEDDIGRCSPVAVYDSMAQSRSVRSAALLSISSPRHPHSGSTRSGLTGTESVASHGQPGRGAMAGSSLRKDAFYWVSARHYSPLWMGRTSRSRMQEHLLLGWVDGLAGVEKQRVCASALQPLPEYHDVKPVRDGVHTHGRENAVSSPQYPP